MTCQLEWRSHLETTRVYPQSTHVLLSSINTLIGLQQCRRKIENGNRSSYSKKGVVPSPRCTITVVPVGTDEINLNTFYQNSD